MSNAIGTFISHRFYNDNVSNGLDCPVEDAMVSISYDGDIEVEPRNLTNKFEIEIIKCLIEKLKSDNVNLENVAIIVPYRDQANLIAKEITAIPHERISTIDAYQGKEFDFIIFGCTRVNGGTKFLDDPKRINVAISRAKQKIFMIGHKETIRKTKNIKAFHNDKNCKRCKYENNRIK
jgi:superfamily I DNA and/or RNA helicase